jgi:heme-degrading monooxygenase HmoA
MFAVIFEVQPKAGLLDEYLNLAEFLKPELEKIDGFIDNERFASRRTEGRLLSLSTWRDKKAFIRWRTLGVHHEVQQKGRFEVFEDYHLRVGEITADTQIPKGQTLREQRLDETETGAAKSVTISEVSPTAGDKPVGADPAAELGLPSAGTDGVIDREAFESIYNPGKLLLLVSWKDAAAAERWKPKAIASGEVRHRRVRIIRDYGMADRREAPQYYPPVQRPGHPPAGRR